LNSLISIPLSTLLGPNRFGILRAKRISGYKKKALFIVLNL